jgi:hypothetical protein
MHCPHCGKDTPSQYSFCLQCGGRLPDDDVPTQVAQPKKEAAKIRIPFEQADNAPEEESRHGLLIGLLIGAVLIAGAALTFFLTQSESPAPARQASRPMQTPVTPAAASPPVEVPTPKKQPTPDPTKLLDELIQVENEWHQAIAAGDKQTLDHLLADEFINISGTGQREAKFNFVSNARPIGLITTISDPRVESVRGNTAALVVTKNYFYAGRSFRTLDTDRFIWRDGRWQITYSQSTLLR